jgi:hypothetical protein
MNLASLKLQRRAEQGDPDVLVQTFVDVGSLFSLLSTQDHQILYGRRGTGKTHALHYLRARVEENGDVPAYIDLRSIGSAGGIYGDPSVPLTERGTRLLSDVLAAHRPIAGICPGARRRGRADTGYADCLTDSTTPPSTCG